MMQVGAGRLPGTGARLVARCCPFCTARVDDQRSLFSILGSVKRHLRRASLFLDSVPRVLPAVLLSAASWWPRARNVAGRDKGNLEEGSSMVVGRAGFDAAFPIGRFVFNQIAGKEADDKIRDSVHQDLCL